jgi:uncharacterized protein YbcI
MLQVREFVADRLRNWQGRLGNTGLAGELFLASPSCSSPGPYRGGGLEGRSLSSHQGTGTGTVAAAISSAVVKLMREYTGRGPTKARTTVLRDTFTMGELSLLREGESELVLRTRKAYQNTMAAPLVAAVEEHSGRKVLAFLSDNHIDPDIAVESFVLVPQPPAPTAPRDLDGLARAGDGAEGR